MGETHLVSTSSPWRQTTPLILTDAMFMFRSMLFIQQTNDPNAVLDQQAEDDAFYAATLREMVAMGLEIGRIIHQQVIAQSLDSPHSQIDDQSSVSYDRVFRAVRRGIMLAKRLKDPEPVRKQAAARRQIARDVGNAIQSQAKSPKDAENLYAGLRDRLDTPDFEEDLENRPIQDIIDDIRKDLGLSASLPREWAGVRGMQQTEQTPEQPPETPAPMAPAPCGTTNQHQTTQAPANHSKTQGPPYPPGS